jgi:arginine deiminase
MVPGRMMGVPSLEPSHFSVTSEIGTLESVVVHSPGSEIEAMTPRTAHGLLYNDIIPLSVVRDEHHLLKSFLESVATVHEVTDLLSRALSNETVREQVVSAVTVDRPAQQRRSELMVVSPRDLASLLVNGVPSQPTTLSAVIEKRQYDLPPLPNLYFTRDSSAVYRSGVIVGAMAHRVRCAEAILMRAALLGAGSSEALLFDGAQAERATDSVSIEGGDLLVIRENLLAVGLSERTTPAAVDLLVERIKASTAEPVTVIAVVLPKERFAIHLDMVFTMVDRTAALLYEPLFLGAERAAAYRIEVSPDSEPAIHQEAGLLEAFSVKGVDLSMLRCGGTDPVQRQREQWLSAANVVAFAPGKVLGYDCNVATIEEFCKAGYTIRPITEFIDGTESVDRHRNLFVSMPGTNLARGGGGPRCMTLPIHRAPVA